MGAPLHRLQDRFEAVLLVSEPALGQSEAPAGDPELARDPVIVALQIANVIAAACGVRERRHR